jgi:hypothetical protein
MATRDERRIAELEAQLAAAVAARDEMRERMEQPLIRQMDELQREFEAGAGDMQLGALVRQLLVPPVDPTPEAVERRKREARYGSTAVILMYNPHSVGAHCPECGAPCEDLEKPEGHKWNEWEGIEVAGVFPYEHADDHFDDIIEPIKLEIRGAKFCILTDGAANPLPGAEVKG